MTLSTTTTTTNSMFAGTALYAILVHYGGFLHSCWLSSGEGTYAIWFFVGPMLAIIIVRSTNIMINYFLVSGIIYPHY